jgi:hypothetical protein
MQYRYDVMIYTKRVILLILSLLFVPQVYAMSYSFFISDVYGERADQNYLGSSTCGAKTTDPRTAKVYQTCCWTETERGPYPKIGTTEVRYCQTCSSSPSGGYLDCKPKQSQLMTLPKSGEKIIQDDGVEKQRVQPFLDSQNDADVPPIGNIEQAPDSTTQSHPGDRTDSSTEGQTAEQSTTHQDNQDDNQDNNQ